MYSQLRLSAFLFCFPALLCAKTTIRHEDYRIILDSAARPDLNYMPI
jgi:hypothetical protein